MDWCQWCRNVKCIQLCWKAGRLLIDTVVAGWADITKQIMTLVIRKQMTIEIDATARKLFTCLAAAFDAAEGTRFNCNVI